MKTKKRSRSSVFDAVEQLESADVRADRKRTTGAQNIAKTKAAQSQTKLHGHLMECRILLQRSTSTNDGCVDLLAKLLSARSQLMFHGNKDYSDIVHHNEKLHQTIQHEHDECKGEWKEVLNRRHKDLQLHSGLTAKAHFKVMDSTFWQQVDATVAHELRLGNDFQEDKLYQHMLQDFLASSAKAPVGDSTKRVVKRTSTNQPKKEVDRRATKGRKIRYLVVPKLVNFTFPVARLQSNTSGMDEEEWFKSLFGGAAKNAQT